MTIRSLNLDVEEIRGRTLVLYLPFFGKGGSKGVVEGVLVFVAIEYVEVVYIASYDQIL